MTITLTWNDFKKMNPYQGGQIIYIKAVDDGVTKCTIMCTMRANITYVFTNPPTKNQFLSIYPGAFQVNDIV